MSKLSSEQIIEIAKEAGLISSFNSAPNRPDIERFAKMIAATERKRCYDIAKLLYALGRADEIEFFIYNADLEVPE